MAGSRSKSKSRQKVTAKRPLQSASQLEAEKDLASEVKKLTKEVQKLKDLEFLKVFAHPWKFAGFSLLKGMMVGLGTVIGASVLVAIVIYVLGRISFVPIVGDFVEDILRQIQVEEDGQRVYSPDLQLKMPATSIL